MLLGLLNILSSRKGIELRILERTELIIFIVAIIGILATVSVLICLLYIDFIVHQQLYSYKLEFSYDWANPYWIASKSSYAMLMFISVALVMMTLVYREQWRQSQTKSGLIVGESVMYRCASCEKKVTKPIKMLDFTQKPVKEINVCPYCHKILT